MRSTYDGYEIAEKDLMLRGPGDFFSNISDNNLRQSGGFEFKFATMCDSSDLFEKAFSCAKQIMMDDPDLKQESHTELKKEVERRLNVALSTIS